MATFDDTSESLKLFIRYCSSRNKVSFHISHDDIKHTAYNIHLCVVAYSMLLIVKGLLLIN